MGAGVLVGATLALVAARWLQPLLFQQSATDPRVFASVAVIMLAVALVATTSPAVRAARADPNAALRGE
jgi:ABC-type lipoprotein release transport system permease subunit